MMTRERLTQLIVGARRPAGMRLLSVRLGAEERARLEAIAAREGVAPATLARLLIVSGLEELGGKEEGLT